MGVLGIVPPYQTLQIIWFLLNDWERAEWLNVRQQVKCRALRYQSKIGSSSKLEVALFSRKSSNHVCIEPEIVAWSIVIMDAVNGLGSLNLAWSMNLYWVWILPSLHGGGLIVPPDWLLHELYLCCCAPGWITCPRHPCEQTYANMHTWKYTCTKWYIPSNEAVSQKWLCQVDVHVNNSIKVGSPHSAQWDLEKFL